MVDPFFQKTQQPQQSQQAPDPAAVQQHIQQTLQQQQLLQQQYNQLIAMIQNPQVSPSQKQQFQQQAQQIAAQYQQNNILLQQLGYSSNHVNKPTVVQNKSGSKISMKGFLLGCLFLLILLVGALVGIFYYLISNPSQLSSVGLDPATTKNLLQVFSVVFFGLIVFLSMGILIVNGYRLATVKNKPKIGYIIGLFLGFILFVGGIALGSRVLNMVQNLSVDTTLNNNNLVLSYVSVVNFTGDTQYIDSSTIKLIAPSLMRFMAGKNFNTRIIPILGQGSFNFNQIILDCGNGQQIPMNLSTAIFDGSCIYFKKGTYDMVLKIDYTNVPTGEKLKKDISAGSLVFDSEITVTPIDGTLTYNDAHTEMVAGKVPTKVKFDASRVFKDFGLSDYKVLRYVSDSSGEADKQNISVFSYSYKQAKLYIARVKFPELNMSYKNLPDFMYTFPLRIEQSDVPVCEIVSQGIESMQYGFSVNFLDLQPSIAEYQYIITANGKSVSSAKSKNPQFQYQFSSPGIYALKVNFITDDGKQGSCESDDVNVGATDFQLRYSFIYKTPGSPHFEAILNSGNTSFDNNTLTIGELPTIVQLSLDQIIPNSPTAAKQVFLDGKPVLSSDNKIFEIKIDAPEDHTLRILIEDVQNKTKTEKVIPIKVKRDAIVGKLLIKPDSVGTDPFTVTLDASTTTLNDFTDEIVYFTRDFGDGEIKKNLSQSILQHTYHYDATKDNGTYVPKVTITTKKGLSADITYSNPIIVKKQLMTLKIIMDSHPGQVAQIGDRVSLGLEVNGMPKKIFWDFGNGKTLECTGRECVQTSTVYTQSGNYTIKAKVSYSDKPEIDGSINLVVK